MLDCDVVWCVLLRCGGMWAELYFIVLCCTARLYCTLTIPLPLHLYVLVSIASLCPGFHCIFMSWFQRTKVREHANSLIS